MRTLDHVNKVELVGLYGGDRTHALSAWTSTLRELSSAKEERMPNFLKSLAHNGHHSPFEKSTLHFLATTDIATHVQLLKHRIGVSVNSPVVSFLTRYSSRSIMAWANP